MICDAVFQLIFSHLKQIDEFERKIAIFVLNAFINAMFGSQKIWEKMQGKENIKKKKKVEGKKKWKKIKTKFKVDKLFFCYFKLILFILIHHYKD